MSSKFFLASLHPCIAYLHNMAKGTKSRGFIKLILLIIIGLVILGYFGLNIKDILASPVVEENLAYAWELATTVWTNWLQAPAQWVFEHIIKLFWQFFLDGLEGLRDGESAATLMQ